MQKVAIKEMYFPPFPHEIKEQNKLSRKNVLQYQQYAQAPLFDLDFWNPLAKFNTASAVWTSSFICFGFLETFGKIERPQMLSA